MKSKILCLVLFVLCSGFMAGCREERAGGPVPIPLLKYKWGQSPAEIKDELERQINLTWTDKLSYYLSSTRRNRAGKSEIRNKMRLISDGAPQSEALAKRLGVDRLIIFRGDISLAGQSMSPTFYFADGRLVSVALTPGAATRITEPWLDSFYLDLKLDLEDCEGEIAFDSVSRSEEGQGLTYNLIWRNERTRLQFFAHLPLEGGMSILHLIYLDSSHSAKQGGLEAPQP